MNRTLSNPFRVVFIILWTSVAVTVSLVLLLVTLRAKLAVAMARTVWSPGMLWGAGAKMTVTGRENVDPATTAIYISNHQSFLDIPAAFGAIPANLHFVAKSEIKRMPFIGWYMMATGMIFIERGSREKSMKSLQKAGQLIRKGKSVIMFPEGTRSKTGEVRQFKKGGFLLARESGVALVPVLVQSTGNVWPPNGFQFIPGRISVAIGKPMPPSEFEGMSLEQMAEKVRQAVVALGK